MEHDYRPELWHDLYVMLGSSSAALIGLLFVATSLHLKEIVNNRIFRLRTRINYIYLIITVVEAALILTPTHCGARDRGNGAQRLGLLNPLFDRL